MACPARRSPHESQIRLCDHHGYTPSRRFGIFGEVGFSREHIERTRTFRILARENSTDADAEARVSPFTFARVSPYAFAGLGRGTSRLNVNEFFPDPVTHQVTLAFGGGGVRVPLVWRVSAFADARFVFRVADRNDELGVIGPIRGGLAWKF